MLRRAARVEVERFLQRADRVLAVAKELQNPHPRRVPERAKECRLGNVERSGCERHSIILLEIKKA